jgi:poly-gamma-glutamate capsule biosynthesis protein CapA/YwtB (metallophosphatase superfamily)
MRLALAGDTMLGRGVADALSPDPTALVADPVASVMRECDLCILNLERCVSARGRRWPAPNKPFFFRAPPRAVELLAHLGVDCVTLANNHALDYGEEALLDTIDHLRAAGIASVGAGANIEAARAPRVLQAGGTRLIVVAFSDHPAEFAAAQERAGIAYARGPRDQQWVHDATAAARQSGDPVLVTPHWGPNMNTEPTREVRAAAAGLLTAGATLVAGHSAHVFHGTSGAILYDLGTSSTTTPPTPHYATTSACSGSSNSTTPDHRASRASRSSSTTATRASPRATTPPGSNDDCAAPARHSEARHTGRTSGS